MTGGCSRDMGTAESTKAQVEPVPSQWPCACFQSVLLAVQPGPDIVHAHARGFWFGFFRRRFLHLRHSLQKKLIKWQDD